MNQGWRVWVAFLGILLGHQGMAQKSTVESDLVEQRLMEKLEALRLSLAPSDPQRWVITGRLADLYAEKARKVGQEEYQRTQNFGAETQKWRLRALELYKEILESGQVSGEKKARLLMQMGQLCELLGQTAQAVQYYRELIQFEKSSPYVGEAYLALGDVAFRKGQCDEAVEAFNQALQHRIQRKGYALFRLAWCEFKRQRINQALALYRRGLAEKSVYFTASAQSQAVLEKDLFSDFVRDYMQVWSESGQLIQESDLKALRAYLEPDLNPFEFMKILGRHLEKLGNRQNEAIVWRFVAKEAPQKEDRLLALGHLWVLAFLNGELQEERKISREFEGLRKLVDPQCQQEACQEVQKRLKLALTHKMMEMKTRPQKALLESFEVYTSVFPEDGSIWVQQGTLASWLDLPEKSLEAYWKASLLLPQGSEKENLLNLMLETADKLPVNSDWPEKVWDLYLKNYPSGRWSVAVIYKQIRRLYEKNDSQFNSAALNFIQNGGYPDDLRIQLAHLVLDDLAQKKKFDVLVKQALEFAKKFSSQAREFLTIAAINLANWAAQLDEARTWNQEFGQVSLKLLHEAQAVGLREPTQWVENAIQLGWKLRQWDFLTQFVPVVLNGKSLVFNETRIKEWVVILMSAHLVVGQVEKAYEVGRSYLCKSGMAEVQGCLTLFYLSHLIKKDGVIWLLKSIEVSQDPKLTSHLLIQGLLLDGVPIKDLELLAQKKGLLKDPQFSAQWDLALWSLKGKDLKWPSKAPAGSMLFQDQEPFWVREKKKWYGLMQVIPQDQGLIPELSQISVRSAKDLMRLNQVMGRILKKQADYQKWVDQGSLPPSLSLALGIVWMQQLEALESQLNQLRPFFEKNPKLLEEWLGNQSAWDGLVDSMRERKQAIGGWVQQVLNQYENERKLQVEVLQKQAPWYLKSLDRESDLLLKLNQSFAHELQSQLSEALLQWARVDVLVGQSHVSLLMAQLDRESQDFVNQMIQSIQASGGQP